MIQIDNTLPFPPPPVRHDATFGANLQRTMTLLATSTPERRNRVRILFYGQSITKQKWWQQVADDLRRRFPHADLEMVNRAIGGFSAPVLKRTAEHDLYPFYPDVVIFHVYGGEAEYEALIAETRRRTTAEILLQSDHISTGQQKDPQSAAWHDRHSSIWLPELAAKYGLELADIREPWKQYLADNHLDAQALLTDSVHLNDHGNYLMAELTKPYLRHLPEQPDDSWKNLARTYRVGTNVHWQDGRLILPFEGNRVDIIAASSGEGQAASAQIRIDGRKPSEFPELYAITRPSLTADDVWPAIIRVGWEKPLVIEEWTVRITDTNEENTRFSFTVTGSQTGPDGAGTNEERFVSPSSRVVIEPGDWWVEKARNYSGKPMPAGFEIKWQVVPLFQDIYQPPTVDDLSREYITTVAQNLSNTGHTLEVITDGNGTVPIEAIRVYRPPLAPNSA